MCWGNMCHLIRQIDICTVCHIGLGYALTYTLPVKSLETVRFLMFLKEVSSAHQGCIYLIKNTVKTVILWNIITI